MRTDMEVAERDLDEHPERSRPRARTQWWAVVRRSFTDTAGFVALVVVAVQAVWRGGILAGGHWTQDDFVGIAQTDGEPMSLALLGGSHAGEVSLVGRFLVWLVSNGADNSWETVLLLVVVLQAVVAALMWVVLSQVLPGRWVRLPLLAVACFTPLTLASTVTWSLSVMMLPSVLLLLLGTSILLVDREEPTAGGVVGAGLALLATLLCSDHSLLMPVVPFLLLAGLAARESGSVRRGVAGAFTRHLGLWITLLVGMVFRILLLALRNPDSVGLPETSDVAVDAVEAYVRQGLTGLVGGPWTGDVYAGVLRPDVNYPMAIAIVLCILLLVPLLRSVRRPVVTVALLGLVGYFVGVALMLLLTNNQIDAQGMIPRTLATVAPVAVLLVALALREARAPRRLTELRFVTGPRAAVLLAVVVTVAAVPTTNALAPALRNADDREYLAALRDGLATDPSIVLLDGPTPEGVIHPWYGAEARVSTLAPLLLESPPFDVPSSNLRMVDGLGLVRPVTLEDPAMALDPGETTCGYAVRDEETTIPLDRGLPAGRHVVQISYFTNTRSPMTLVLPEKEIQIPVRDGLRVIQVPVEHDGLLQLVLRLESGTDAVCVGEVAVGVATPDALPGG